MRSLRIAFVLLAFFGVEAHAQQTLGLPCATSGDFCGRLISPQCIETVEAGPTGSGVAYDVCAPSYVRYRECLQAVSTSCSSGQTPVYETAPQPQAVPLLIPKPAASLARPAPAPALAPDTSDDVATLSRCKVKGSRVTCSMMYQVGADRDVSFCEDQFGLTIGKKDGIAPSAVSLPGNPEMSCPSQKLFAFIPVRFRLEFKVPGAKRGREVLLKAFSSPRLQTFLE